jgi:transposase
VNAKREGELYRQAKASTDPAELAQIAEELRDMQCWATAELVDGMREKLAGKEVAQLYPTV